ncbi:hypothetical protein TS59_0885 [Mycoplasma mycoides subsp. mycoides]|uniref:Uncharacterized protein n=1 Tax=Mycoplasma mycoides subsp. mycoides TaxID=2103 RepID=A0AAE2EHS8_MYCMY|nr:hypothetical protein MSCT144_03860 [Mycoplasma mycoides subsp. mycoides]KJQ45684.1 hypothetical protein TS59_0885 [Mycoplasma mycoides subsp. mycoides]KJQ46697.1 hypothetical protein TS60_0903 [Mycoplasma mycoides subsp. mycoides]BCU83698.1 hypothetical protein mmcaprivi_00770 [Mycoplasma mycoides]
MSSSSDSFFSIVSLFISECSGFLGAIVFSELSGESAGSGEEFGIESGFEDSSVGFSGFIIGFDSIEGTFYMYYPLRCLFFSNHLFVYL